MGQAWAWTENHLAASGNYPYERYAGGSYRKRSGDDLGWDLRG